MLLQTCVFAFICVSQVLCNDKGLGSIFDTILEPIIDNILDPIFGKDKDTYDGRAWDGLVVTWANPRAPTPDAFKALPRTVADAKKANWTELDNGCKDKTLGFLGRRFILNNQADILLIFDKNGYIAGIQIAIAKDVFDQNQVNDAATFPPIVKNTIQGKDLYVLTAYFVSLEKICRGRTAHEFKNQGTGTKLSFFNGTHSHTKPVYQARKISKAVTDLGWMKENCVPTMGLHYFNDFGVDKVCAEISPFALLFDPKDNELLGFNYFIFGNYISNRFEHPPKETITMFADPLPTCYSDAIDRAKGLTSLHVFLISKPLEIKCA